jgi:hypothetical protein
MVRRNFPAAAIRNYEIDTENTRGPVRRNDNEGGEPACAAAKADRPESIR